MCILTIEYMTFEKCKMSLKGVRKSGEKVKVMISTLKEQASATDDPDLQVKFAAQLIGTFLEN